MKKLMCTMASTVLLASMAGAKTVVWYHFNEGAVGTQPTSAKGNGVIVNAANPGVLNASVARMGGSGVVYGASNWLPTYEQSFGANDCCWDPVAKVRDTDNRGLHFMTENAVSTGVGSIVVLDDDVSLHLPTFTAELFVRKETGVKLSYQAFLCQLRNGSTQSCYAWGIRLNTDGALYVYATSEDGKTGVVSKNIGNPSVLDGDWHHVALTYDGARLRAYVDYVEYGSYELAGITYPADVSGKTLTIGTGDVEKGWGRFRGYIDEFRLSDRALSPAEFLGAVPKWADEDTLVYIPCNRQTSTNKVRNVNLMPGLTAIPKSMMTSSVNTPQPTANVPKSFVRDSLLSGGSQTNDAAYAFVSGATAGRTGRIAIDDVADGKHTLLAQDALTMEFFVKPDSVSATRYLWAAHFGTGSANQLYVRSDGKLQAYFYPTNSSSYIAHTSPSSLVDGAWHHVALVTDVAKREVYVYLDYQVLFADTNCVLRTEQNDKSGYYNEFNFGAAYNDAQTSGYRGMMDEIRVTKRALLPREFMTTYEVPQVPSPTVFYAPLDGDETTYPFPNSIAKGTDHGTSYIGKVPGQTIPEKEAMGLAVTNSAALVVPKGAYVDYGRNLALEGWDTQTVEFFAKLDLAASDSWAVLLRQDRIEPNGSARVDWSIGLDTPKNLHVRIDNEQKNAQYISYDTSELFDNKWHHVAVTFEKKTVGGAVKTEIRLYVDGVEKNTSKAGASKYLDGVINGRARKAGGGLFVANTVKGKAVLSGRIDEVRVSNRVLAPSEFLHAVKNRVGLTIMVR